MFWWALRISPIVWSTFFLVNLFSPSSYPSLPVLLMGAALSIANFIGYWRCDRDAKKKLQSFLVNRLV